MKASQQKLLENGTAAKTYDPVESLESDLRALERRNNWIWALTALLLVVQGLAVALLYLPEMIGVETSVFLPETRGILVISLSGLTILFCLYVFNKQIEMRKLRIVLAEDSLYRESVRIRLSELSTLFEVTARMGPQPTLQTYLQTLAERLLLALDADGAAIFRFDAAKKRLWCEAESTSTQGYGRGAVLDLEEGIPGWVARNSSPVALTRDAVEMGFPESLRRFPSLQSILSVPLRDGDTLIGVLFIYRAESQRPFQAEDTAAVMLFGEQIVSDMRKLNRVDTLSKQTDQLEGVNKRLTELHDMKRVFLSTVKNEICAPLAGITYHSELLSQEDQKLSVEKRQEYLRSLSGQVVQLADFVNEITDLLGLESRTENLKLDSVEINDLLNDCVLRSTPTAAQKGVVILTEFQPNLPSLNLDQGVFTQAIHYLLSHAVRLSDGNETIRVSSRLMASEGGSRNVVVTVANDDAGEVAGARSQTLELGLFLVKELIELNRGSLSNRPEKGIVFHLPVPKDSPSEDAPAKNESQRSAA